jgi:hypothetical protein
VVLPSVRRFGSAESGDPATQAEGRSCSPATACPLLFNVHTQRHRKLAFLPPSYSSFRTGFLAGSPHPRRLRLRRRSSSKFGTPGERYPVRQQGVRSNGADEEGKLGTLLGQGDSASIFTASAARVLKLSAKARSNGWPEEFETTTFEIFEVV